eukprot:scaffold114379_cov19-Tisochrysis_lutea.AAC.1
MVKEGVGASASGLRAEVPCCVGMRRTLTWGHIAARRAGRAGSHRWAALAAWGGVVAAACCCHAAGGAWGNCQRLEGPWVT